MEGYGTVRVDGGGRFIHVLPRTRRRLLSTLKVGGQRRVPRLLMSNKRHTGKGDCDWCQRIQGVLCAPAYHTQP